MSAPAREEQFRKLFGYPGGFPGTWVAAIGRKPGLFRATRIMDLAENQKGATARRP